MKNRKHVLLALLVALLVTCVTLEAGEGPGPLSQAIQQLFGAPIHVVGLEDGQVLVYDEDTNTWGNGEGEGGGEGGGGGETLAQTLAIGASTGGTRVTVTSGDSIDGQTVATTGGTLPLRGGLATSGGDVGGPIILSTAASGAGTTYVERVKIAASSTTFFGDGTINATQGAGSIGTPFFAYRSGSSTLGALFSFSPGATDSGILVLGHARGTPASPTIVADGDDLGFLVFQGQQSATGVANGAFIRGQVDGTPGASADMPGRVTVWTTPDGSASSVERTRVSSAGVHQVGNGTISQSFLGNFSGLRSAVYAPDNVSTQSTILTFSATAADLPYYNFMRGRGTAASPAIVVDGDALGYLGFSGVSNSAAAMTGAAIRADTDGTWTDSTSAPGRLSFLTTPAGSSTAVEHLRIASTDMTFTTRSQSLTFNDASNTSLSGSASGATSVVGAINQVSGGTYTKTEFGTSPTLSGTIASGVLNANGDALTCRLWGEAVATETISVTWAGTTILTVVAAGTGSWSADVTIMRTSANNVDVIGGFFGGTAPTRTAVNADSGNLAANAGASGSVRGLVVSKIKDN